MTCATLQRWHFYPRPPGGGRHQLHPLGLAGQLFLSTPSGWRATTAAKKMKGIYQISIHALRVEGDGIGLHCHNRRGVISIHALRVEGDIQLKKNLHYRQNISIHALRVEGDRQSVDYV